MMPPGRPSRAAGMTLRARIDVPGTGPLPGALGRTVYRVIQEGLTNARKHAPGAAVEVTVTTDGQAALVAEVISHRPARDLCRSRIGFWVVSYVFLDVRRLARTR